ncbi:MAG: LemA family protein [Mesorhizobium sp.]|nr:LemA family protein [Mesorhizobium sp.]
MDFGIGTVVLLLVVAVLVYGVVLYNGLVRAAQMVKEAWSGIDVQLKRRADLIPNLVATVKGYAAHERAALEEVTELRNRAQSLPRDDVAARAATEGQLTQALTRLFAVAEAYPDLKANQNFLELQKALSATEDEIQYARRYYNGAVRNLNVMVESVPSNIVAASFGFRSAQYFQIDNADDRAVPRASFP